MVIRERVSIHDVELAMKKHGIKETKEVVEELRHKSYRPAKEPPPTGSICIREAARKYGVHHTTILKWIKKGILPVIKNTSNWTYVNEIEIRNIINKKDNINLLT